MPARRPRPNSDYYVRLGIPGDFYSSVKQSVIANNKFLFADINDSPTIGIVVAGSSRRITLDRNKNQAVGTPLLKLDNVKEIDYIKDSWES